MCPGPIPPTRGGQRARTGDQPGPSGAAVAGRSTTGSRIVCLGFAALGAYWGAWTALVPGLATATDASLGQLGLVLAVIAAGTIAAMRMGRLWIRLTAGPFALPILAVAFAICGLLPGFASDPTALTAAAVLVGFASGAYDVALTAAATRAPADGGRSVLARAHTHLAVGFIAAAAVTGLFRMAGAGPPAILAVVCALGVAVAALHYVRQPADVPSAAGVPASGASRAVGGTTAGGRTRRTAVVLAALAGLAYVVEGAWYGWGAVQIERTLAAGPAVSAAAPAVFAAAAVVGRVLTDRIRTGGTAIGRLISDRLPAGRVSGRRVPGEVIVAAGAALGAVGTAVAALVDTPFWALVGIAMAGAGVSGCAPVLVSLAARAGAHGVVGGPSITTITRLGFLLGPAVVGGIATVADLRFAFVLVALVAAALAALAVLLKVVRDAAGTPPAPSRHLGAPLLGVPVPSTDDNDAADRDLTTNAADNERLSARTGTEG